MMGRLLVWILILSSFQPVWGFINVFGKRLLLVDFSLPKSVPGVRNTLILRTNHGMLQQYIMLLIKPNLLSGYHERPIMCFYRQA